MSLEIDPAARAGVWDFAFLAAEPQHARHGVRGVSVAP
jgi:hypothetical protein